VATRTITVEARRASDGDGIVLCSSLSFFLFLVRSREKLKKGREQEKNEAAAREKRVKEGLSERQR
jgi:hypothetical protein